MAKKSKLSKKAKGKYLSMGPHGAGKTTDKVAGDKRTVGAKLYQVG